MPLKLSVGRQPRNIQNLKQRVSKVTIQYIFDTFDTMLNLHQSFMKLSLNCDVIFYRVQPV